LTINHDFEGEASADSYSNLKLVKNESVVFCANLTAGAMEKVISNQQKNYENLFFCYKRGCGSSTIKLISITSSYHNLDNPDFQGSSPQTTHLHF
jgi:hypothetical protein